MGSGQRREHGHQDRTIAEETRNIHAKDLESTVQSALVHTPTEIAQNLVKAYQTDSARNSIHIHPL
jgi:hypothetical protein